MSMQLLGSSKKMHIWLTSQRRKARAILMGYCLSITTIEASAVVRTVTASFSPDANNPQRNQFTNTTSNEGFCLDHVAQCKANNMFSLRVTRQIPMNGPIQPDDPNARKGAMIKAPATWRLITVTNRDTRESTTVEVRISGIGGVYTLSDTAMALTGESNVVTGHRALWGTNWATAPAPCRALGSNHYYGNSGFSFFWLTPVETTCSKPAKFLIPGFGYQYLDYSYELRTPDPLKMSTGIYEGTVTYSVGPNGDIDLGDHVIPTDPILQLDFILTVQHTLKVEVPPGGTRVELLPQGGWQAWLQRNRRPERLFRDQTFNISASSRFKMKLECQYVSGDNCALWSTAGHAVPLEVAVTLPGGLADAAGDPVNRRRLRRDGVGTELFQPGFYLNRKPGTLHFEVARDAVEEMIKPGTSRSYSGNVTVIWDSQT